MKTIRHKMEWTFGMKTSSRIRSFFFVKLWTQRIWFSSAMFLHSYLSYYPNDNNRWLLVSGQIEHFHMYTTYQVSTQINKHNKNHFSTHKKKVQQRKRKSQIKWKCLHSIICVTYLWLYRLNFCIPNLESMDPFDTGNDSKLAISKFIEDFSSSMYNDSISLSTNFGINFRFFSISATRCIRPSNSRRIAAACSSFESSFLINRQKIEFSAQK